MKKILVILGPNLNMVGVREKGIYGEETAQSISEQIKAFANEQGFSVEIYQSNHEGDIVDKIQRALGRVDGIVINPAAYTHTSIAILDALKAVALPTVEVHLSDIHSRESFRNVSITGNAALKIIHGFGFKGYQKAMVYLKEQIEK